MYWQAYGDMPNPKVEPDLPNACSTCCNRVPACSMWGIRDESFERGGWVICDACHLKFIDAPLVAWQAAQDRWDTEGPCK